MTTTVDFDFDFDFDGGGWGKVQVPLVVRPEARKEMPAKLTPSSAGWRTDTKFPLLR